MDDADRFGGIIALVAVVALVAVLSNRLTERIRVPAPAIFLVGAAVASDIFPWLGSMPVATVEEIVTVALIVLLFDGGMHIGWGALRRTAGAVLWLGVVGTLVTAAAVAVAAHYLFDLDWRMSLLIGTALAPTDPAVVFSVLGRREILGRSGTLLEGESGANDPVGIALMVSILAAGGTGGIGALGAGVLVFVEQMGIGAVIGVIGGAALHWSVKRVSLPSAALYSVFTLAAAVAIYGAATVVHGSGFLAVFIAGIMLGDARVPFKGDTQRFHSALASLAEIVAFVVLGLTVSLRTLPDGNAWLIGLVLGVVLALVIRPVLVGLVLLPVKLDRGERLFALWAGLKGAVPILLGTFIVAANLPGTTRIYDVIFVVVAFSVIVQGGLVPFVGRRCRVPMRTIEPEPWVRGMRFRQEPAAMHTHRVAGGSPADGMTVGELAHQERVWPVLVRRDGQHVPLTPETTLRSGDEILVDQEQGVGDGTSPFHVPD
ncbi:MAG: cation:proton antiporter [Actinocatenispora sp.]